MRPAQLPSSILSPSVLFGARAPRSCCYIQNVSKLNSSNVDETAMGIKLKITLPLITLVLSAGLLVSLPQPIALAAVMSSVVTTLCGLIAIESLVFKPLKRITSFMRKASAASNLSLRVPSYDAHLFEDLIESLNDILDATEHSYFDMLQARYDAESANKAKSLFISKVSHELRTPIHSITGMLRILLKQEHVAGKRQYIQMARDSADALLDTINEVLDYSKMQSGSLSLEHEKFKLADVLRSTIEQLIPRFEEKPEVALCWDMHPGLPDTVVGDPARMKNILINLLGNAFKFTERGHVILEVSPYQSASSDKTGVRFSVIDTGIGIAGEKLHQIFEPFTTLDERSARMYAGTGLGLAIVKQIAEQMGGAVTASSRIGEGSSFIVDLLFDKAEEAASTTSLELKRVALLSDECSQEWVASEGFRRYGCDVSCFRFDAPGELELLTSSVKAFDLVYIIKGADVLIDEITPIIRIASREETPVILSRLSSELASAPTLTQSEFFQQGLQPLCAHDVLMIASGALTPTTSIAAHDDANAPADQKLNILVADDAKTNRIILKSLLEEAGHSVELVENGKQMLEKISYSSEKSPQAAVPYDLVLTDIQMPIMDGLTATQNFREMEKQVQTPRKLPIVAVTSYALPEECSKMLALGIDHIITKPINPKRLTQVISQITNEANHHQGEDSNEDHLSQDSIQELCQITESIVERVSAIAEELKQSLPIPAKLDVDILDVYERSGNSMRRTGLILNGFLESYAEPLRALEDCSVPVSDPATFRRTAHSLKGLLLDVGAKGPGDMAAALEKLSVASPSEITRESIEALGAAIRSTVLIVKEVVEALPSVELFSALPPIEDVVLLH